MTSGSACGEPLADGDGPECLSQRESQGKSLERRAVAVTGRKVGDRVISIVQPVSNSQAKPEPVATGKQFPN